MSYSPKAGSNRKPSVRARMHALIRARTEDLRLIRATLYQLSYESFPFLISSEVHNRTLTVRARAVCGNTSQKAPRFVRTPPTRPLADNLIHSKCEIFFVRMHEGDERGLKSFRSGIRAHSKFSYGIVNSVMDPCQQ